MTTSDSYIQKINAEVAELAAEVASKDIRPEPRVIVEPEPTLEEKLAKAAEGDPEIALVVRLLFKIKELAPFKEAYEAEVKAVRELLKQWPWLV